MSLVFIIPAEDGLGSRLIICDISMSEYSTGASAVRKSCLESLQKVRLHYLCVSHYPELITIHILDSSDSTTSTSTSFIHLGCATATSEGHGRRWKGSRRRAWSSRSGFPSEYGLTSDRQCAEGEADRYIRYDGPALKSTTSRSCSSTPTSSLWSTRVSPVQTPSFDL